MKFSDAELQSLTGYPIASGHLSIGSSADMRALGIPKHQRVLLAYPHGQGRGAWMIWPVIDATPRETGFYDAVVWHCRSGVRLAQPSDCGRPGRLRRPAAAARRRRRRRTDPPGAVRP